jgi:transposase
MPIVPVPAFKRGTSISRLNVEIEVWCGSFASILLVRVMSGQGVISEVPVVRLSRVATRYDKLAANYLTFIKLASIRIWLRERVRAQGNGQERLKSSRR